MRVTLTFKIDGQLILPSQYNYIFQAVILKWLGDENYQKFIHDTGYEYNNRTYKMYTFSRLEGKFTRNLNDKTISYYDSAKLSIASVDSKFLNYIVNNVLYKNSVSILNQRVFIESVHCIEKTIKTGEKIYTKSPIVTYSTFEVDDKRKTYYYSPYEDDFSNMLRKNLLHKFNAVYGKSPDDAEFAIKPIDKNKLKESVVVYKGTVIKGWNGDFVLEGSEDLLNIAYNTGLGSKNGQGFGYIEVKEV